jgi:MFS family permease
LSESGAASSGTRGRLGPTLVITSAALFMVTLDNLVVTTALPAIRADLSASLSGLAWTVNAYTLAFCRPAAARCRTR